MRCARASGWSCFLLLIASAFAGAQTPPPPTPAPVDPYTAYTKAMQAKDWLSAISAAQHLVQASPTANNLRCLGDAQLNAGEPNDALATYDRALAAAQSEKPAEGKPDSIWKSLLGRIYTNRGNASLRLHRNADALDSFTRAADVDPNPAIAFFNLCATAYNTGNDELSLSACRRASQADPSHADIWFILGSVLLADSSKTDANGKLIAPPECRQALDKYLELAPNGPRASDVRQMLDVIAK